MPRQLQSTIHDDGTLELALAEVDRPQPGPGQVLIRVEAAPINPSDIGPMLAGADLSTLSATGDGPDRRVTATIPAPLLARSQGRLGAPVPLGNEGAGTVVEAGDGADHLVDRTVATWGGSMYAEYRLAPADQCVVFDEGFDPRQAASAFVNPLTALGMIATMRAEGHTALVHTAAASNLGQMLVRLCRDEDVPLVNVVRRPEQVALLRELGAEHVCDSSEDGFMDALVEAVATTDATLGFDATGGGRLASRILTAMEVAQSSREGSVGRYGSARHKQVYIYGGLDPSPTELTRSFGMAWGVGGWLLPLHLQRVGREEAARMRDRVAAEITTTFASSYTEVVSLDQVLDVETITRFARQATGEKFLVDPSN